jgi:hypothetical protein
MTVRLDYNHCPNTEKLSMDATILLHKTLRLETLAGLAVQPPSYHLHNIT